MPSSAWSYYFDPDEGDTDEMHKYILVDPASSKKKGSDYTVMVVIGLGADQNYYLLDAARDRLNLTERCAALFRLHRKWRPIAVGFERYGMLSDIEYVREEQRRQNYRFEVIELGGKLAKEERIRRMIPIFESGRFYLPTTLWLVTPEGKRVELVTTFIDEEYKPFPVAVHDDFFDAISRICDTEIGTVWPHAAAKKVIDRDAHASDQRQGRSDPNATHIAQIPGTHAERPSGSPAHPGAHSDPVSSPLLREPRPHPASNAHASGHRHSSGGRRG